ncbi:unnamed protein product [Zymoseptoria tritici ST99CH_1A5]|uniref:Arrestin-like N-terminal domain-containing protein n=1 Tax=Zymoseptoria tritici ST99CH_1A5 TaxID=1276529 RepID=A0A1Y6L6J3_ZYMTR|nr:unnamed protein product [Zymoseptoria tritici ST99CH_1A5]
MSAFHPKLHAGGPSGVGGGGPSLSQWTGTSSSLSASIALDQDPNHSPTHNPNQGQAPAGTTTVAYTNLDVLSGRVLVRTTKSADIANIVVKLEGESRSRLMTPPGPNGERSRAVVEYHKILYKTQTVFPPSSIGHQHTNTAGSPTFPSSSRQSYTLPIGTHAYPFSFKLPFNNSCNAHQNAHVPVMVGMDVAMPASQHVKRTLPPTLSGFPGEAEIRYFVKVTVVRQSLFKENPRAYAPFNFFPIEPPRPRSSGSETYARQRHAFTAFPSAGGETLSTSREKMRHLFGSGSDAKSPPSPTTVQSDHPAPAISLDARLPEPAILTCSQSIPLRLLIKRLNTSTDPIHLTSLQISLIGHTKIRAHEVFRTESQSWIVMSKSNLDIPLLETAAGGGGGEGQECVVDENLWKGCGLPNTVAPGFVTCNIQRFYQIDVRVGLAYRGRGKEKPQTIILPLRLDTQVFSGIAPPPEVLARMAAASSSTPTTNPINAKLRAEGRQDPDFGANTVPYTPVEGMGGGEELGEAPPPSYEDAIAEDAAPVRAPRPVYVPPVAVEDRVLGGGGDEKKGWH